MHFYPEGTRSLDGYVQRFHRGAFELAVQLQQDILPVLLADTNTAMPRHPPGPHEQQLRGEQAKPADERHRMYMHHDRISRPWLGDVVDDIRHETHQDADRGDGGR